MKTKILFTVFFVLSCYFVNAQKIQFKYLGGGYQFTRSALKGINRWVDGYNTDPNKIGGWIMDENLTKIKCLSGVNASLGIQVGEGIFDITYSRRRGTNVAHYSILEESTFELLYKMRTVGVGYLFRSNLNSEKLQSYAGVHLDFSSGGLYTIFSAWYTIWYEMRLYKNWAITPSYQIIYSPFTFPVSFGARVYWQMNMKKNDFSVLEDEVSGNWPADESWERMKSSGGNIGIMFQVFVTPFKIKLPERKIEPDIPVLADVNMSGLVRDAGTNVEIGDATIKIEKYHEGQFVEIISMKTSSGSGNYEIKLPRNVKYRITVEAFGYDKKSEEFELTDYSPENYQKDFLLPKLQVGQSIILKNIYFKKASAELLPESFPELDKLYKFMNMSPTCEIEIAGHTSSEGNDDYNQKLSQDRAQSVVNYLKGKGIAETRMVPRGYGEKLPIADNDTEAGKELNRRVEFKILKQ